MGRKRKYVDSKERKRILQQKRRENKEKRKADQEKNTARRKAARSQKDVAERDKAKSRIAKKKARLDSSAREAEQSKNTAGRKEVRKCKKMAERDKVISRMAKQKVRLNSSVREAEQATNTARRKGIRINSTVRAAEQARNTAKRRAARKRKDVAERDKIIGQLAKKAARQSASFRSAEQAKNSTRRNSARKHSVVAARDNATSAKSICKRRMCQVQKAKEQCFNTKARRNARLQQKTQQDWEDNKTMFFTAIYEQPDNVCCSCGMLCYRRSVTECNESQALEINPKNILVRLKVRNKYYICQTCKRAITRKEKPKLALSNGLMFPNVPDIIANLTPLEERLVALRTPFMQIRTLGVGMQKGLHGGVINVPNNVEILPKVLPRKISETSVLQVKFMRQMVYKKPYMFETIRPMQVFKALKLLMKTSLYKEEKIVMSDEWETHKPDDLIEFVVEKDDLVDSTKPELQDENTIVDLDADDDLACTETLLEDEIASCVRIAPSQGQIPKSLLLDEHAEELSFPTIYGGHKRVLLNNKISRNDVAKSELRRFDRRCGRSDKLLFSYKLVQTSRLYENTLFALRRKKKKGPIVAKDLFSEDRLQTLIQEDCGYKIFQNITGSPAYLQQKKKNAVAMIRQLGLPTFFITISSAETMWPDLLCMISNIKRKIPLSPEAAMQLSKDERSALVREDPALCVIHYENRERALERLLEAKEGVFSPFKCTDYIHRREVQQRGSLHGHRMQYVEGAPFYDGSEKSAEACCNFIDQFITCHRDESEQMKQFVGYQFHCHKKSCWSTTKKVCRFGFPKPPLPRTMILKPLECCEHDKSTHMANYSKIQTFLNASGQHPNQNLSFEEILEKLHMKENEYIMAIRSSLKRPKEFLKRNLDEIFLNQYNKKLLEVWGANIDIQFILDPYACVSYCVNYISKSNRGSSRLMKNIDRDIRRGNMSLRDRFRFLASTFLNSTEISTQEGCVSLLGFSMVLLSRDVIFINTSPPDERTIILKSLKELKQLDPDSTDIAASNFLTSYENRPDQYEDVCLADFASLYRVYSISPKCQKPKKTHKDVLVYPRVRPRIIRYRRYSIETDASNYYREQCMLFIPYRSEEKELLEADCMAKYKLKEADIIKRRSQYNAGEKIDFENISEAVNDSEDDECNCPDYEHELPFEKQDFGVEMGVKTLPFEFIRSPELGSKAEYIQTLASLNEEQRKYVLHVNSAIKKGIVLRDIVHGQAGTGKSRLITAIVEMVTRDMSSKPGFNLSSPPVLVCASTGKAAFNVTGTTLHSAFRLPHNSYSGSSMAELDSATANTLRCKLENLVLLIIDEISLVSFRDFYWTNQRLRQAFQDFSNFGGISVVCVGDFWQLPPVLASNVFSTTGSHISKFKSNESPWDLALWADFQMFELTEVMRQKQDKCFGLALNRLAIANCTDEDVLLFRSRENLKNIPNDAVHLFHSNKLCDKFNERYIKTYKGALYRVVAHDIVQGDGSLHDKKYLLDYAWETKDADGLPYAVNLKVGCIYMVTSNVDVSDGIFNGATGILRKIEFGTTGKTKHVSLVYLEFSDPKVGQRARELYGKDSQYTPIFFAKKILRKQSYNRNLHIVRKMIPLTSANAITIHKSQGSTLNDVVVHIPDEKNLSRAHLYVAFSRATSLDHLYIVGTFRPPSYSDKDKQVKAELDRLIEQGFISEAKQWQTYKPVVKGVVYNTQSLMKYLSTIKDSFMADADFIAILEPHMAADNSPILDGFTAFSFLPENAKESKGCVIFLREKQPVTCEMNTEHTLASFYAKGCMLFVAYRPPRTPLKSFLKATEAYMALHGQPDVLCGDLNVDLLTETNESTLLNNFMYQHGYSCLMPFTSTTTSSSMLDVVFSRISGWASPYFDVGSFHNPIILEISASGNMTDVSNFSNIKPMETFATKLDKNNEKSRVDKLTKSRKTANSNISLTTKTVKSTKRNETPECNGSNITRFGIANAGNTCYVNAIVQMLATIPAIRRFQNLFLCKFLNLVHEKTVGIFEAQQMKIEVGRHFPQFDGSAQEDASEFLNALLNSSEMDAFRNINLLNFSRKEVCLNCGFQEFVQADDQNVFLIVNSRGSYQEAIDEAIYDVETVEKTCDMCRALHFQITKRLENLPEYLFIVTRLFDYNFSTNETRKLVGMDALGQVNLNGTIYELLSIVCHQGDSLDNGHYVSYIKGGDTFFLLNDHVVSRRDIVEPDAYICLYRKKNYS